MYNGNRRSRMKIVGHGHGSVVVLFPPEEIRPTRGLPITKVVYSIGDRYGFLQVPDLEPDQFPNLTRRAINLRTARLSAET